MIVAVVISNLSKQTWKKKFRHLNRIRTHGFCVSAAVLYHLSYEDPYIESRPICWVNLNRWKEWNMKMMWTAKMDTTNSVIEVLYYLIALCYFFLLSLFCVTVCSSCLNFVMKWMNSYLIHYLTTCRIMFKKFTCIVMKKELFKFYCSWSVFTFSVAVVMGATTMPISVTWRDWGPGLNL